MHKEQKEWNDACDYINVWKRDILSRRENICKGLVEITLLAGSGNKKMTCRCQDQTEQGKGTKSEIREGASVHKSEEFLFYPNCNGKPF